MILENARFIELHLDRCLNSRHFRAACDYCVKVCPSQAIKQNHRQIEIISERCTGCGLCLQECPAEVFVTKKWDERYTLNALPNSGIDKVTLFCDYHSNPKSDNNSFSLQLPVCLGAMSKGIWFELGIKHEVVAMLDQCQNCPMSIAKDRIINSIEYGNEWLQACGYKANIVCMENVDNTVQEIKRSAISADKQRMSRRGFFLSFYKNATKSINNSTPGFLADKTGKRKRLPHVPKWINNLARAYPQEVPETSAPAYWPYIEINKACCACDACTEYCPTGALTSLVQEDSYNKYFTPGLCLNCHICMETCPKHAITRSQKPIALPFEEKNVFKNLIDYCPKCGQVALSIKHNGLCYWCAEEPSIDNILHDARRVLFASKN